MNSQEQVTFSNGFGTVTNKRVMFQAVWLGFFKGRREDTLLKQIVSATRVTKNIFIWSILFIALGWAWLPQIIGIIPLVGGTLLLRGLPLVIIKTSAGDSGEYIAIGWPWERKQANEFAEALRQQLFID